jgi:hypothetical protein
MLAVVIAAAVFFGCQKRVKEEPRPVTVAARPVSPAASAEPPAPAKEAGVWVESDAYDLKLVSVTRCAGDRLGLKVRIRSKVKSLFVGPRDATLLDGGVRYEALRTADHEGCRPTLATAPIRYEKETEGYVVFEVARELKQPVLEYTPTRWGGAGSVRVAAVAQN